MLTKSKIFLFLCLGFILGVFLGRYVNYTIMAISAMIFVIALSVGWQTPKARVIGELGLVILLGAARFQLAEQPDDIVRFLGQELEVKGTINQEPDIRSDKAMLTIGDLEISGENVSGRILITVPRVPEYEYGDRVNIQGGVEEPRDAAASGEFSYKNYLSSLRVAAVSYYPTVERIGIDQGNPIKSFLLLIKSKFVRNLSELLPEPHNSFMAGLLVGLRRGMPENLLEAFSITGITHIIAISGFNITIIAKFIDWLLLNWFNRRTSFLLAFLSITAFVILVGGQASVVRAGIMGVLGLLALNIGRVNSITNAIALTATAMVGINPQILHFDAGFQLSFLALMGLVYLSPIIENYLFRLPSILRMYLSATLAAQIFTLPIILYNFDRLSLIAPLANILVLPVVPLIMLLGFLSGIFSFVFTPLAMLFAWSSWAVMEYVLRITLLLSELPWAAVEYYEFQIWMAGVFYLLLAGWLVHHYHPEYKDRILSWKAVPKNY